jgi:hypothetical protein
MEVEEPQVKARVLAVLQALSGEKSITEICHETGLKPVQYYKLEDQMVKGMVMAAQASLTRGRRRNPLAEARDLEDRNVTLRQENQRMQALLRLTRKLFKTPPRGRKTAIPKRGRPPKPQTTKAQAPAAVTASK